MVDGSFERESSNENKNAMETNNWRTIEEACTAKTGFRHAASEAEA